MSEPSYALVALPGKVKRPLTYSIPEGLRKDVRLGTVVRVPLRGRQGRGVVVRLGAERGGVEAVKEVVSVPDSETRRRASRPSMA